MIAGSAGCIFGVFAWFGWPHKFLSNLDSNGLINLFPLFIIIVINIYSQIGLINVDDAQIAWRLIRESNFEISCLGILIGLTVGSVRRRRESSAMQRALIGTGSVLFAIACIHFLVRDPVRELFTVLSIATLVTAGRTG